MKQEAWSQFRRQPTPDEIQAIEDRLQFLGDVLPRYLNLEDLQPELDNLDLDLHTFLSNPKDGITPWLVHCDWLHDVDKRMLGDDGRRLLIEVVALIDSRRRLDLAASLHAVSAILSFLHQSVDEDDSVAALSALDFLVSGMLTEIGRQRLQRLLD